MHKDEKNPLKLKGMLAPLGQMDESYLYEAVDILPAKGSERFESEAVSKEIPRSNFVNGDLPNLRARYLKEMISASILRV